MAVMATSKRPRVYFDADEELKTAISLEALKRDIPATELIEGILREALRDTLPEAKKIVQARRKREQAE